MSNLYTFILEYNGGTYISQIEGSSNYNVMINWIKSIDLNELKVKNDSIDNILQEVETLDEKPTLLTGMKNVWCITFTLDNKFALVNFIKTNKKVSRPTSKGVSPDN